VSGADQASRQAGWRTVLTALVIAELAAGLETTLMFAALPTALRLSERPGEIGLLITGYLLVSAAAAAVCSRLGDLLGRKAVLLAMLGLATIGSIISALSPDLHWIIAGRAIQGLSGAVLPLCYGLLRESLPARRAPFGIGLVSAANSFSAAAGFIIGGVIVDRFRWQDIFVCSALLTALGLLACWVVLPPSRRVEPLARPDLLGGLLFSPAIGLVVWGISLLPRIGAGAIAPWAWIIAGLLLLGVWAMHEYRQDAPLIDVRLLANRRILAGNLASICASLGALQVLLVFPVLLQQPVWTGVGFGLTATLTGLLKLPSNLASVVGAGWGGALCARIDNRRVMVGAALSSLIAWAWLWAQHDQLWWTVVLVCFSSAGFTTLFTGVINIVVSTAPPDRASEATAMTSTFRTVAQSVGSQIVTTLFAAELVRRGAGPAFPAPAAHDHVLAYLTLASAGALAAALWMPRSPPATA
jgi:MFS family permease